MKITRTAAPQKFEPIAITITFETRLEAEEFFAVFNYPPIVQSLHFTDSEAIRKALAGFDVWETYSHFTNELEAK